MAQKGLSMRKIEEILRLKWEKGLSNRAIAKSCRISAGSVSNYIQRATVAGLSWPLPENLGAEDLEALLFPHERLPSDRVIPQPDWRDLHKELKRKGVTLSLLWLEYRAAHPDGYSYSQYCYRYRAWTKPLKPVMHQRHKAGEKLFRGLCWADGGGCGPRYRGNPGRAGLRSHVGREQLHLCRSALGPRSAELDRRACSGLGLLRWRAGRAGSG